MEAPWTGRLAGLVTRMSRDEELKAKGQLLEDYNSAKGRLAVLRVVLNGQQVLLRGAGAYIQGILNPPSKMGDSDLPEPPNWEALQSVGKIRETLKDCEVELENVRRLEQHLRLFGVSIKPT